MRRTRRYVDPQGCERRLARLWLAIAGDDGRVELVNLGGRSAARPTLILVRDHDEMLFGAAAEIRADGGATVIDAHS